MQKLSKEDPALYRRIMAEKEAKEQKKIEEQERNDRIQSRKATQSMYNKVRSITIRIFELNVSLRLPRVSFVLTETRFKLEVVKQARDGIGGKKAKLCRTRSKKLDLLRLWDVQELFRAWCGIHD